MLYLVGLGLSDETDITVKGLDIVKKASRVYLEAYTSILLVDQSVLESYYGRSIIVADREMVEFDSNLETENNELLHYAATEDVALLVVGDPFGATTHADLVLRARQLNIPVTTVPNASIMNGIGACGLQLYNFGQTVSMVFFTDNWRPASFYDRVRENRQIGLHTLLLLDIKVKEQTIENMMRGNKVFEPPRYMTVGQCARQMLEIEEEKAEGVYGPDSLAIGAARVGGRNETFVAGTLKELCDADDALGPRCTAWCCWAGGRMSWSETLRGTSRLTRSRGTQSGQEIMASRTRLLLLRHDYLRKGCIRDCAYNRHVYPKKM
ncbi:diphthine synthase [Apiospora arundinis]